MLKQFFMLSLLAFLAVGEAQATPITYTAILNGASEASPNGSPGTGSTTVVYDDLAHTLLVDVTFSGLTVGGNTAAHIHCCTALPDAGTAGVATTTPTFTGFPTGSISGTYNHLFDLTLATSWNPAFITAHGGTPAGAEAFFAAGLAAEKAYLNIHTATFPSGEIRGFLKVPEPATWSLLGFGLLLIAFRSGGSLKASR